MFLGFGFTFTSLSIGVGLGLVAALSLLTIGVMAAEVIREELRKSCVRVAYESFHEPLGERSSVPI